MAEPLHVQERILDLRQVPMLRAMPPRALAELATSVELDERPPGSRLIAQGRPVRSIAWILEGRARWERGGRGLGSAELGASIGLLEASASTDASAHAAAETRVVLARVGVDRWVELLEDSFDLMLAVLSSIAGELCTLGRYEDDDASSVAPLRVTSDASGVPAELDFAERLVRLRASGPFLRAPIRALAVLAQRSRMRTVARGGVLWERGSEAREVVVLLSGSVMEAAGRYGPGDVAGLMEALAGRRREAPAVARTPVTGIALDVDALIDVLEDDDELALELLRVCAGELLASSIARGLPPDVLVGAPDRSLPRAPRRAGSPHDTIA